ncbi:hypothetical protein Acr_00g0017380 [Actinidia rufa]|uniref:Chromo domain-containing protein n=1 Tax=Actinidia rufa TaxID=165716 RepID=A0A7J0DBF6_9ERIC|nr:hypothetical protein Acr_00g0017380 [Actinidia rufa]
MKEVQFVEEEREVLEDVDRTLEAKVVEDLTRYELSEPSSDRYFLIGSNMKERERTELIEFLIANIDIFTWMPYKNPGIDPTLIKHRLNVMPKARSKKQRGRACKCGDRRDQEIKIDNHSSPTGGHFGYHKTLSRVNARYNQIQVVDEILRDYEMILKELQQNLIITHLSMKAKADKHRREVVFHVLAHVSPVVYKLELPEGAQIHDVFHVSLLKLKFGTITPISQLPPPVSTDSVILPQPYAILNHRIIQKGNYSPKNKILVQWKGTPRDDATWENQWQFSKTYPEFILADKDLASDGIDMYTTPLHH